jgi:DNA-binding transcriptional regulator YiaG
MTDIAAALKTEIARLARKELKAETSTLKKSVAAHRHDIAALKKRVQELERLLRRAPKANGRTAAPASEEDSGRKLRFSSTRLAAQRKRLGLSAADFAALIGVSPLSVYKWEGGKNRPRQAQLEAIAAVRKFGKREARARLEELQRGS